jgi:hypothetical protein
MWYLHNTYLLIITLLRELFMPVDGTNKSFLLAYTLVHFQRHPFFSPFYEPAFPMLHDTIHLNIFLEWNSNIASRTISYALAICSTRFCAMMGRYFSHKWSSKSNPVTNSPFCGKSDYCFYEQVIYYIQNNTRCFRFTT